MVFVLEDLAKLEADARVDIGVKQNAEHVIQSADFLHDNATVRAIRQMLEPFMDHSQNYVWRNDLGGILSTFTEAFLNAGYHGNKAEIGKRITVDFNYGVLGGLIYVKDEGKGFDYQNRIGRLQRGEQIARPDFGGGMRNFKESHFHIAYHGSGNIISIATAVHSMTEFRDSLPGVFTKVERVIIKPKA